MRVSSYLIGSRLADDRFFVLLHGFTGALDKVPASLGEYLVGARGNGARMDSPLADCDDETLARLHERGYLTDLDASQERDVFLRIATTMHERDLMNNAAGFMFVPTYTCNLRCPYCFQAHAMHAGKGEFATIMTRASVDQAFAVIDRFQQPGAVAQALGLPVDSTAQHHGPATAPTTGERGEQMARSITLFGGEPLSALSLPIVPYIVEESVKRGFVLSAVTNGVQLELFADLLGPGLIRQLQITLDGLAERHDRRRIGPGFRRTFDRIVGNIGMALQRGVEVSVRLNFDQTNVSDIGALNDFFRAQGWLDDRGFSAYGAAVHHEPAKPADLSQAQLVQITLDLGDQTDGRILSYENWARDTLTRVLDGHGYPFRNIAHCAAETGLLIFDPLGDVYACWEEVGERQHRIATYGEHGIQFEADVAGQWLARFPGAIDQCSQCPYALIHTSGCASHARKSSGTLFASACESFQEYFPKTLAHAWTRIEGDLLSAEGPSATAFARPRTPAFAPVGIITTHSVTDHEVHEIKENV